MSFQIPVHKEMRSQLLLLPDDQRSRPRDYQQFHEKERRQTVEPGHSAAFPK